VKNEMKTYVIGHKNPDTDSICSSIAYADIKNRTAKGKFFPKRAGAVNEETPRLPLRSYRNYRQKPKVPFSQASY